MVTFESYSQVIRINCGTDDFKIVPVRITILSYQQVIGLLCDTSTNFFKLMQIQKSNCPAQ